MRTLISFLKLVFLSFLFINFTFAQWVSDPSVNTPICTDYHNQDVPLGVSDGAGGMILTWRDQEMSYGYDVYAQRINSEGIVQWALRGIPIAVFDGSVQQATSIISDGSGGAYIGWYDLRANTQDPFHLPDSSDAYIQHVNSSGEVLWGENGMSLSPHDTSREHDPYLVGDGAGGVLVFWGADTTAVGYYDITNIYGQHYNPAGEKLWGDHGVAIALSPGGYANNPSYHIKVVTDGSGGAYVFVPPLNSTANQMIHVSSDGEVLWITPTPGILRLVSDNNGGVIYSYETSVYADTAWFYSHHVQRINSEAEFLWGEEGTVFFITHDDNRFPKITPHSDGGVYAFYNSTERLDIYCQRIDFGGVIEWDEPLLIMAGEESLWIQALSTDADNSATIIYGSLVDYDIQEISAQCITPEGYKIWGDNGSIISNRETAKSGDVAIANGVEDGHVIVWSDLHPWEGWDLYGQYVNQYGNIGPTFISTEYYEFTQNPILVNCYPNPFNGEIKIDFTISMSSPVTITIYNVHGVLVFRKVYNSLPSGHHIASWNTHNPSGISVPSGMYLVSVSSNYSTANSKIILVQ